MHLDEHLETMSTRASGQLADEFEGFGKHEATRPGPLDRVAHGVEPYHFDPVRAERAQDLLEIFAAARMRDVDVDLLRRERGPEYSARAIAQRECRKRQARPRPIDREQVALRSAVRKYAVQCQEQPRESAPRALLHQAQE